MKKFIIIILLLFPTHIYAAGLDLSISPPLVRVQIKPGKSITKAYTIENKTPVDQLLVARVVPFNKSDLRGNPVLDLKTTSSWINYFSLSNTDIELGKAFTLKANSKQQLVLSLSVPETAPLRDLYVTLLVSTYSNTLPVDQKGTLISASIGSNLLVSVTSELNPKTLLKVENVSPYGGAFIKFGNVYIVDNLSPISFSATASNIGDFTTEIRGIFKLSKNKQPIYMEGIMPEYVISKSERTIIPNKNNEFTFSPQINHIGFYQAGFEIRSDNVNSENSINLFFFPFKAMFGLIVGLSLLKFIIKKP